MKRTNIKRWLCLVLSLVMVLAVVPGAAYADTPEDVVVIDETNFPDDVFRAYVSEYFDTDGSGSLDRAEIDDSTTVILYESGLTSLKGLEYLTELTYLDCESNQLTELNLSSNPKLVFLNCAYNQLTSLDVSNNAELVRLYCHVNKLESLDVSSSTGLVDFDCASNQMTLLDVSNNTALEFLWCSQNKLTTLDVSKNTALENFGCGYNELSSLDVSNNTCLENLWCDENKITELDVSGLAKLTELVCSENQLTSLDVSNSPMLTFLSCGVNQLGALDVSNNTSLENLYCSSNNLTALDLSKNTNLESLSCNYNYIERLDITACPIIMKVYLDGTYSYVGSHYYVLFDENDNCVGFFEYDLATELIPTIDRIAGKDRFKTALEAADQLKEELGLDAFPSIVIASGTDFPDALAGAYLAIEKDAPVLLTSAGFAPTVAEYAKDNLAEGGTVYILGGKSAVPEVMEIELGNVGIINVKRLAGSNRYATNIEILKEAGVTGRNLMICSGTGYADSLSASALGQPILLVGNSLTDEQKEFLTEVKEDMSADFFVLGGTGAVSEDVFNEVKAYAKGTTERVSGKNRFLTSVAIAQRFLPADTESVVLAYAMNYPDGLAGGPIAYATGSPLLLVTASTYSDAAAYAKQAGINKVIVMGGKSLIPNDVALAMVI